MRLKKRYSIHCNMKRPNLILTILLGGLLKVYAILKGQKITQRVKITHPALILCNHTSFYDFVYTTAALYPHRVTHFAAAKMFYDPNLGFFLRLARAIPKSLFQSDMASVMKAFRILKKKGIVCVFPEGQISSIGKTLKPPFAIAKMIQKMGVDVFVVKHHNAYFSNPPWSKKTFRGPMFTTMEQIFSANTVKTLSEQTIFQTVFEKLDFNSSEYNAIHRHRYRLNDIANLENLIYRCHRCEKNGLIAKKDRLYCPHCHSEFVYDHYGMLDGQRLDELYHAQEVAIYHEIDTNPQFSMENKVQLESYVNDHVQVVGSGVLTLTKTAYRYQGTINGEVVDKTFLTKHVEYVPSDIGVNIQIYVENQLYQFVFEEKNRPTQFVIAGEYLYRIQHS